MRPGQVEFFLRAKSAQGKHGELSRGERVKLINKVAALTMVEVHAVLREALKTPGFHWVGSGPGSLAQLQEKEIALVLCRLPQSHQLMVRLQLRQQMPMATQCLCAGR